MKPLGRKPKQIPAAKHKPKHLGKNVPGWWENIVVLSPKRERQAARQLIRQEAFP